MAIFNSRAAAEAKRQADASNKNAAWQKQHAKNLARDKARDQAKKK